MRLAGGDSTPWLLLVVEWCGRGGRSFVSGNFTHVSYSEYVVVVVVVESIPMVRNDWREPNSTSKKRTFSLPISSTIQCSSFRMVGFFFFFRVDRKMIRPLFGLVQSLCVNNLIGGVMVLPLHFLAFIPFLFGRVVVCVS